MADRTYTIADSIAHEVLEGEAILINFTTGSYYSLDGIGSVIWEYLSSGPASAATLAGVLSAGLSIEAGVLHDTLDRFLEELEREGLLARTDQASAPLAPRSAAGAQPFEAPVPRKYTDLGSAPPARSDP